MQRAHKLINGTFLIFGTTVGAGMLGIPAVTAAVGFYPAVLISFGVWLFMVATGFLLVDATVKMHEGANLVSLTGRLLGKKVKWVSGVLFLLFYGSLLVAYFSGGSPLLGQMMAFMGLPISPMMAQIIFALIFGGLIFSGTHWISRINLLLGLGMLLSYAILIGFGVKGVETSRLTIANYSKVVWAVPILFSAFGYHNIIPTLVNHFGRTDKKLLKTCVVFGTFLALIFYVLWQWLVLGSVSLEGIQEVRLRGLPVTYALQTITGHPAIYIIGQIFAFLALITSFLGVGVSFVDFIQDGFREHEKEIARSLSACLTVVVPFICVLLVPSLFEKALGVAGGFGVSILNGILPVLLFVKILPVHKRKNLFLAFLTLIALSVVSIEFLTLLGF